MLYIQLYSNYIIYSWPSIILDYAVSADGRHCIWQLLLNIYNYLWLKTHRSDSSSERVEGVGAMGTARSLKVPLQDSGQKKMGEEGWRLKKYKVGVIQLNDKNESEREWTHPCSRKSKKSSLQLLNHWRFKKESQSRKSFKVTQQELSILKK